MVGTSEGFITQSAQRFAQLLQEGINAIADRTSKPKGVIRDELGYALGRKGGSGIEYWAYGDGHIPSDPAEVEKLARSLVVAGRLDCAWLTAFLESAGYPNRHELIAELLPAAVDQPPDNLPLAATPFVGRTQELADLAALLANPDCRLITLTGPGGSGKTRLALEVARRAQVNFADGTIFVALAPLTSAEWVAPTIATALNLSLGGHADLKMQLVHYLRRQTPLLILDNFEQLLPPHDQPPYKVPENPGLTLINAILAQVPKVTLLVTSRERLNLQGEWVYDVGGLAVSNGNSDTRTLTYSAPTLFVQAAQRGLASFTPSAADEAAILHICRLVEGMPLAIELAAAWVRVLSCQEIATEIAVSLDFLITTLRDLPQRHRSMRAVFDHSWKLLSVEEQQSFARCSVFRGGFTRAAAEQVAGATLPVLAALVDQSLLSRNGAGRYAIHELARQYGADRLAESKEVAQIRNRHLTFFMRFAETAEPQLHSGQQVAQWHDQLELEHDNLRLALNWSYTEGEFAPGLRMVGALWEFWMNRGHVREGREYAERFLARPEAAARTYERARALHTAGVLAFYQGRSPIASSLLIECIAISRELGASGKPVLALALIGLGYTSSELRDLAAKQVLSQECLALSHELRDVWVEAHALYQLGGVARAYGDVAVAQEYFLKSFECFQTDGESVMRGTTIMTLGEMLHEQGHYDVAREYILRGLTIFDEVGDSVRKSMALSNLGNLAMAHGDNEAAQKFLAEALTLIRRSGHLRHPVVILNAMGRLAQRQGEYVQAYALHQECLNLCLELGQQDLSAGTLEAFAYLATRCGQTERAVMLFAAANACFKAAEMRYGVIRTLRTPHLRTEHESLLSLSRSQLGEPAFAVAWATGAAMDLTQAVEYALTFDPAA